MITTWSHQIEAKWLNWRSAVSDGKIQGKSDILCTSSQHSDVVNSIFNVSRMLEAPAKKSRHSESIINYSLCIICQKETGEELVDNPSSHHKVLEYVKERALYRDNNYPDIWHRLKDLTSDVLKSNSSTWHRKCYQDTVHTGNIKQ